MNENGKKARSAVDRNRKVLLNIDLELNAALAELKENEAVRSRYRDDPTKNGKRKFYGATIEKKKLERFVLELTSARDEILKGLERILSAYEPADKAIWIMYFIQRLPIMEIADRTSYARRTVQYAIERFKADLVRAEGGDDKR